MAFKDLREYVAALEEHGELRRIKKEVDWNLQAGAIMRLTNERKLPSAFFEKIKGYSPNCRILGSPLNSYRKLAIAMGLPPETPVSKLEKVYEEGKKKLVKPVLIDRSQASC